MKAILGIMVAAAVLAGGAAGAVVLRPESAPQGPCALRVAPGEDINRAATRAPAGATVCLAAGTHRPVSLTLVKPGVTLQGAGADTTIIQPDAGDGIDLTNLERITLADLTVRGGSPAGIYAARVRGLTLRGVRVENAAIGLHVEGGTAADLSDVTVAGTTDFGLLVRRGASVSARGLHVIDHQGIGVGAVDAPGSFTLAEGEVTGASGTGRGEALVLNGFERFALASVTVRGGNPAGIYVAAARELSLREVQIDEAVFGLHLDNNAVAKAEDVTIARSSGVGLLVQRGATVDGHQLHVLDAGGTGVSVINGAGPVALRDSEIGRVAAAGLFAGVAGCAELPPASLEVPPCFSQDLQAQISTERVVLERVNLYDTLGPCLVFFPGVHAEVRDSTLTRCQLTGLYAWGAAVDVSGSAFEDNAEHALEYRAFPDPRGNVLLAASGTIQDSTIRATRPLEGPILGTAGPGPVLGGGILAQGAQLTLRRNEVSGNRDIGVSFVNRAGGEVTENRITGNGNIGLCLTTGTAVFVRDNTISGNRSNSLTACGGRPAAEPAR